MRRGRLARVAVLGVCVAIVSSATSLAAGPGTSAWLEVDAPSEGEQIRSPLGLVELRGRLGSGERGVYDVVVALDVSQSAFLPTGLDLDGDGTTAALRVPGRGRKVSRGPFRSWTTDAGDTVIHGEIVATRRLLATLHRTRARVALIQYSGRARVLAPLGSIEAAERALADWTPRPELTGTSPAAALERGLRELEDAPPFGSDAAVAGTESAQGRKRAIVLLASDGLATASLRGSPGRGFRSERLEQRRAADEARRAGRDARSAGVGVYALEIRNQEDEDPGLLTELSELTSGRYVYVHEPARLRFELPNPGFAALDGVEILNRSLDAPARAVRVFSNGEFDAFVPLAAGPNRLRVRARLADGSELELERTVEHVKPARAFPSDTARIEALRDELRRRTLETRALPPPGRAGAAERARERAVRVQVPNALPDPAPDEPEPSSPRLPR